MSEDTKCKNLYWLLYNIIRARNVEEGYDSQAKKFNESIPFSDSVILEIASFDEAVPILLADGQVDAFKTLVEGGEWEKIWEHFKTKKKYLDIYTRLFEVASDPEMDELLRTPMNETQLSDVMVQIIKDVGEEVHVPYGPPRNITFLPTNYDHN